ncbi:SDR family NAD(P)-dependent oxidoreductase [Chloroflexota bacterium]
MKSEAALLQDKVAIVTGGGGGIGKGISLAFAAHRAKIVVAEKDPGRASDTVAEIKKLNAQAIAAIVDVREKDQVAAMAEAAFKEFGQVDILVNNVGDYMRERKSFVDTTADDWETMYSINLKHVFLCTQAIAPKMIERGAGGSIINVSTIEAFRAIPGQVVYSAFKGAITQFTTSFAMEVAQHRIRVNAIAPDMIQSIQLDLDQMIPLEQRHMIPIWMPLGRFGIPDDIAGVAVFLASNLSSFITGTTLHADGGTYIAGGWYRSIERDKWTNMPLNP